MASTYTLNSGSASWMPLWRKEISYSGTLAMTKVFAKHEMRTGMDFVRLELNHHQAEWGDYGLKGGFSFSGNTTGAVGYTSPGWNSFAAMLMGLPNYYAEDTQTETMTGRENQFAFYVRDRWTVSPKLTVSARCPPPLLPAHDPRRQGHRDPQLQHLRGHAGRHRRPAEGRGRQHAGSGTWSRASVRRTASTRTRCSERATA